MLVSLGTDIAHIGAQLRWLQEMHSVASPVVPVICHTELGPDQEHLPLPQVHAAVVAHPSVDDWHAHITHNSLCVAACRIWGSSLEVHAIDNSLWLSPAGEKNHLN